MAGRDWPRRLSVAAQAYNRQENRRLGAAPNDVTVDNANLIFLRLFGPMAQRWSRVHKAAIRSLLPIGSMVRVRIENRGTNFSKANVPRNSAEIYSVGRIRLHPREGIKYKLFTTTGDPPVPIAGTWNASELVRIRVPEK